MKDKRMLTKVEMVKCAEASAEECIAEICECIERTTRENFPFDISACADFLEIDFIDKIAYMRVSMLLQMKLEE